MMELIPTDERQNGNDHSKEKAAGSLADTNQEFNKSVVILGSGDMATALANNCLEAELRPVIATRNPERTGHRLAMLNLHVQVATIEEGLSMGDMIIVAIPSAHHNSLPEDLLKNKILIDISNRTTSTSPKGHSLAENLQDKFPNCHVVKAFNTLSAYALSHKISQAGKEVLICGDTEWARKRVASLVKDLGYTPVDKGTLRNARALEDLPFSFFPEWRIPLIVGFFIFLLYWLIELFRGQLCPNIQSNSTWDFNRFIKIPLHNTQVCLGYTAASLLMATYIPGTFAAYLQLYRGTKYSLFPGWLDKWLKCRKQLGLLALLLGITHGLAAILYVMPEPESDSYTDHVFFAAGPILAAILAILGITSLPSVSAQLSWREFSFIQRYFGWFSILFLLLHGGVKNWNKMPTKPECVVIISLAQIFLVQLLLTILLKIPLLMPCVNSYLTKIRNGYERHQAKSSTTRNNI